jgi:hypothetical protein
MQVGQKITGAYLGDFEIKGTITELRRLTVRTDGCFEYMIDLDHPIVVYGEERKNCIINAKFDGSPSSYTKHTDWIKAVQ